MTVLACYPPARNVVGDVGASAVAGEEARGEIDRLKEFSKKRILFLESVRLGVLQEAQDVDSVIVLGRELVFRGTTVVD